MKARAGLGCVGLLVLAIGGWVAAHRREPAPPRWTEVDVPRPAHDANGWAEIARHRIDPIPDDVRENVLRQLEEPELDDEARATLDAAIDRLDLAMIESSASLREAVARHPRFFDGCPLHYDTACSLVETLGLWDHYQVAILATRDAELAAQTWTRAADLTSTCRSVVGCILGLQLLKRTLRVAAWLVRHDVESIEALRVMGELDLPREHFQRAVIGDYIEKHALFLDDASLPFLTDRAQTLRFLARDYEAVHAYAARDGTARPPDRRYADGMLAWLYNIEGKELLDMLGTTTMISDYVERWSEEVDALEHDRDDFLRILP